MAIYLLIGVALLLSAFFSGMEIAFVSSNKLRFEVEKAESGLVGRMMGVFYQHPQQYITTILVGNNIVLVVFSIQMNNLLTPVFSFMQSGVVISFVVSLIATIIVLFIGEYLPKTLMRRNPNKWLMVLSPFMFFFYVLLYPVAWLCTIISKVLLCMIGEKWTPADKGMTFSRADLSYLVQESMPVADEPTKDAPSPNEMHILQNALDFSKVKVRDCLVPRTEIVALPYETSVAELKTVFQESGFSKIPIFKGDIDNIIGYIHCSEMFEHQQCWKEHIRKMPIVPENLAAQKLMSTFMQQKRSMAVVVDEFGGTAGIVTLEDIMEEIVGEIEDEYDTQDYIIQPLSDKEWLVSARWEVEELNEKLNLHLPLDESYDTLAGLILQTYGGFPKINEALKVGEYTLRAVKITNNRIEMVKIMR